MITICIRILKQMKNDHRSLGLLLFAPMFILLLLYFILGDASALPVVSAYQLPEAFTRTLSDHMEVNTLSVMPDDIDAYLYEGDADALIAVDSSGIQVYFLETNAKTAVVQKTLQSILMNQLSQPLSVHYSYTVNSDNQLDSLSFVFLGVLAFFFVFLLSGVSFVNERHHQTLSRMLQSPLSKTSIIGGYLLGYGILSTLQSILLLIFSAYVLKLHFEGSILLCILIMTLLSFCAVSVGTLLSIFAKTQLQMIQFIPIVIVPQIFFSGLLPLDTIPFHIGKLSILFPVYYGCISLKKVIVYGSGIADILPLLGGLLLLTFLIFTANVFALSRHKAA